MGAFITISDASGRTLYRRPATDEEVRGALRAAQVADAEAHAALERMQTESRESEPDAVEGGSVGDQTQ